MSHRLKSVFLDDVGYEIKGLSNPLFKRKPLAYNEDDIDFDVPNGDRELGRIVYNMSCAGCHDLDGDLYMGPAMRTCYLRKAGSNKGFGLYATDIKSRKIFWTRRKLWEFLENPEKMFPDTNMQVDGLQDQHTMSSLIDYLHYLRVFTSDNSRMKRPIF